MRSLSLSFPSCILSENALGVYVNTRHRAVYSPLAGNSDRVNVFVFIKQQLSVTQNFKRDDSCCLCFDLEFVTSDMLSYEFVPYLIHVNQSFFLPFFFLRKSISEL